MKKIFVSIMVLTLMVSLIGCSPKEKNSTNGDKTEKTVVSEIKVWIPGDEAEYPFFYNMFRAYEEKNANVKFKIEQQPWGDYWTKLPIELDAGTGPDMFMSHTAYANLLVPNSRELPFEVSELSNIKDAGLFVGETGKPVFVPLVFYGAVMYLNEDHWNDAGLTDADIPKTWDELEDVAQKLTVVDNGKIVRAGIDVSTWYTMADLMYQQGQGLADDEGKTTIDSEAGKNALEMMQKWEKELKISDYTLGNGSPEDSFIKGKSSIIYGHAWMHKWFNTANEELKFKAFPIPTVSEDSPVVTRADMELSFGIGKKVDDEKYDILVDFTKFVLDNDEIMLSISNGFSGVSSRTDLADKGEESSTIDAIKVQMPRMIPMVLPGEYETVIKQTMQDVLINDYNIEEALKNGVENLKNTDLSSVKKLENEYKDTDQLK
ncbi:ABC transporter substrate-binding protein [Vallitalea maricola]|uniref:Extracellular solute-binding protein n=1 Tax=Vallitalea maricola TaxID=3074433 RepID=A0ACB5UNK3_9FIRM|nr:extracellular solute-binding protein [Vallitalea sp. AN17-2]